MDKIYIVSPSEKRLLINYKNNHPDLNFDILLESELKEGLLGKVSDSAIIYLKNKGYSFSNAKKIKDLIIPLKNEDSFIVNFKELYKEFLDLGFVEKKPYFEIYLKNKEIILSPYTNNSEIRYLLKDYGYIVKEINEKSIKRDLYEFNTLNDACLGLYSIIDNLLNEGIKLEKIKIVNSSSDFIDNLKSLNIFYQFPFVFEKEIKKRFINSYVIFKELLKQKSLKEVLLELQEDELIREFISIYISLKDKCNENDIIEYLDYYVESSKTIKVDGLISFVDKTYIPLKDEVLIVPCFVSSIYPSPKNDSTYPGDKEFKKAHILTSEEKNELERINFKEIINSEGKVIFLKHKYHLKNEYFASVYEDLYSFNKCKIEPKILSKKALSLNLVLHEDNKRLFGKANPYKNQLDKVVSEYRTYYHQFKEFDEVKKSGMISLSYSSLSEFLGCPFKYYLSHILKIDPFSENYHSRKGTIFHAYIEDTINNKKQQLDYYLDMFLDKREKVLSKKSFSCIDKAFELHNDFVSSSSFSQELLEQEFTITLNNDVSLYGRIDALLKDDENKIVSVLDFKTNKKDFDKRYVHLGEYLQLPIYLLILSNTYKDYTPIGAYISTLVSNNFIKKGETSDFKLKGVTSIEEQYRNFIDPSCLYIAGIKPNKDGSFRSTNRLVDQNEMKELINYAYNYVIKSASNIKEGKFYIKPRHFGLDSSCKYCPYKDICYKEDKDNIIIPKFNDEEEEE